MAEVANLGRGPRDDEAELRRRIEDERRALDRSLTRLNYRVKHTFDWRQQATRHKGALIAAAGGLLLLGVARLRRRTPKQRLANTLVREVRAVGQRACETLELVGRRAQRPAAPRWPRRILGALAAAGLRALLSGRDVHEPSPAGDTERQARPLAQEETWRREKRETLKA
jgi:hypothetical protein